MKRWVLLPRCEVVVILDNGEPEIVGYSSPKAALEEYLARSGNGLFGSQQYKVEERSVDGITMAYAMRFDPLFRTWNFVTLDSDDVRSAEERPNWGTCIEGIGVEFAPPGFAQNAGVLSLANATGRTAPKTNVARSSLENTPERRSITRNIYSIYAAQLREETDRLVSEEGFSLSRAINEIEYLVHPLQADEMPLSDPDILEEVFSEVPMFLVEDHDQRRATPLADLRQRGGFWTVSSLLNLSIERVIAEMPVSITSRQVFQLTSEQDFRLPQGPMVSNLSRYSVSLGVIEQEFEIVHFRAWQKDRRVDAEWKLKSPNSKWINANATSERLERLNYRVLLEISRFFESPRRGFNLHAPSNLMIPTSNIAFDGLDDYGVVAVLGKLYLKPGTPLVEYLAPLATSNEVRELARSVIYSNALSTWISSTWSGVSQFELDQLLREFRARNWDEYVTDWNEFSAAVANTSLRSFDPFAWSRSDNT
jgi:hypothetical protein